MNSGAADRGADVIKSFIGACSSGRCRMVDRNSNLNFYSWIFMNYLQSDDLLGATRFILDTIGITTDKKVLGKFGLVLDLVLKLRQAWKTSNHVHKEKYLDQIDSLAIPVLRET
jgi:hypothetical protein